MEYVLEYVCIGVWSMYVCYWSCIYVKAYKIVNEKMNYILSVQLVIWSVYIRIIVCMTIIASLFTFYFIFMYVNVIFNYFNSCRTFFYIYIIGNKKRIYKIKNIITLKCNYRKKKILFFILIYFFMHPT